MKPTQEQVLAWYEQANGWSPEGWDKTVEELERFAALAYEAGRADENEACVKVCKDLRQKISNEAKGVTVAGQLMAAIRARMEP